MLRTCVACGRQNRVPARHLSSPGKCGACKALLPPLSAPLDVNLAEFDDVIANAQVPVLVDFWASWCGPCRLVAPELKKLAAASSGEVIVLKVDTEQQPQLAARYGVQSIPHFVVFTNGRVAAEQSGAMSQQQLASLVRRAAL